MALPAIGELNRRIVIKAKQDMPAMGGGITVNDTPLATVWAKHQPVGAALYFGGKQIEEGITDRFFIRRSATLNERTITGEHVIEWDGQRHRVKRASDLEDARKFVMIETENLGNV